MRCTMYQHADVPVMSFPQCRIMISASYRHASSCCPTSLSPVISCHIDVSCPMLVLFPILSHLAHSFDAGIPKQLHHHVLHHTSSCIFPRRTPSFIAPCSLFVLLPSSQSPHLTSSPSYSSPHCTSPLIVPPATILLIVPVTSSPLPSSPLPSSYVQVEITAEPVSGIAAQRAPPRATSYATFSQVLLEFIGRAQIAWCVLMHSNTPSLHSNTPSLHSNTPQLESPSRTCPVVRCCMLIST